MSLFNFFKKKKNEDKTTTNEVVEKNENQFLDYKLRNDQKDAAFYTRGINLMQKKAKEEATWFEEYKKKKPDAIRTKTSFSAEAGSLLAAFQMQYCRGDSLESLKPELESIFALFSKSIRESSIYNETLNVLSLGILFGIPKTYFEDFYQEMKSEKVEDYLFSYLVNSILPEAKVSKKLIFKTDKVLQEIVKIIEANSKQEAIDLINDLFKNNWYTKKNFEAYYNTHTGDGIFLGYYAWAVAAVVKIKNIDDSSFKDSPYYPADLVHWQQ